MLAITIIGMVFWIAMAFLAMAYNISRLMYSSNGGRTIAYYRAQAGVVDAISRIRNLDTTQIGGGSFLVTSFSPTYWLDINFGGGQQSRTSPDDIQISISAADANGSRTITVIGSQSNF